MIQGKNILLRSFKTEDAEAITQMKSSLEDNRSFLFRPYPTNIDDERDWIKNINAPGYRTAIYFAIEEAGSKNFVGYCVARNIDYINANAEVGIIFTKDFRGKGYFKEVSYLFYSYLFNELRLHKIYSFVVSNNSKSLDPSKKLGFVEEGRMKEHAFVDGKFIDLVWVSMFNGDLEFPGE